MGKLIICPTPLGNLGDMPPRAVDTLRAADVICAEDTRVTGKLLAALGVENPRLERLDENLLGSKLNAVIERVERGEVIAYCTDAGMPGVSDPGLRLVRAARKAQVEVEVLPGPTAAATAYVASGTDATAFYFGGFFPRKDAARKQLLESLKDLEAALIFYESPNRVCAALKLIAQVFPFREVCVCRELSKLHEEVLRGISSDVAQDFAQRPSIKGEIVLVIDKPSSEEKSSETHAAKQDAQTYAYQLVEQGLRPKEIATRLSEAYGLARNSAYDIALEAKKALGSHAADAAHGAYAAHATHGVYAATEANEAHEAPRSHEA